MTATATDRTDGWRMSIATENDNAAVWFFLYHRFDC